MFEPPVSTPTARMTAKLASRMIWYSLSVSVWMGATVMESPVWTPIGSKFSMEQMMTQLSAWSRMTSISNSFQPRRDSSMRISETGRKLQAALGDFLEFLAIVGDAAAGAAQGEGGADDEREAADFFRDGAGFVQVVGDAADGNVQADGEHEVLEDRRSSPRSMASALAPIISTPYLSSAPRLMQGHGGVERGLAAEGGQQDQFGLRRPAGAFPPFRAR